MKIGYSTAKAAFKKMASINVEVPRNAIGNESLGLLVGLWCQKDSVDVSAAGRPAPVQFGFRAGDLYVETKNCRISNKNRYSSVAYEVEIGEEKRKSLEAGAGAEGGFDLGSIVSFIPFLQGKATAKIARDQVSTERSAGTYKLRVWRCADGGRDFWRLHGVGLNQDHVLENRLLGDETLCDLTFEDASSPMTVTVTFVANLRDLWVGFPEEDSKTTDKRFAPDTELENRKSVARAIIGKALKSRQNRFDTKAGTGQVALAAQRVQISKNGDEERL